VFYFLIAGISLFVNSLLILSTNLNIYPELYFFPWLVLKGLVPYKDFFDHHGFLLYYILAPLTTDSSFYKFQLFNIFVESFKLIIILLILKRTTSKVGYGIGAFLSVLVGFFIVENNFWYDELITVVLLFTYFLLTTSKSKFLYLSVGILIAIASMIKPNTAILILPIYFLYKDYYLIYSFMLSWIIVLILFLINDMFMQFFYSVIGFNSYLFKSYHPIGFSEPIFIAFSFILFMFTLFYIIKSKQREITYLSFIFVISSIFFFGTAIVREHYVPLMTFLLILISQAINTKLVFFRTLFIIFIILFGIDASYEVIKHPTYLNNNRIPWQSDSRIIPITKAINKLKLENKIIYAFTNYSQIYMLINQLPPTYFPYKFPLIENYIPMYENQVIKDLKESNVNIAVVYKPDMEKMEYNNLKQIYNYIKKNFIKFGDFNDYELYVKQKNNYFL